jgi:hypothetical protein
VVVGVTGRLDAQALVSELKNVGVTPLYVAPDGENANRLTVYLHAPAGRLQRVNALRRLRELDGISAVGVRELTWTILRVVVQPK